MSRTVMQCLGAATRIESLAQELYTGLATTFQHQPFLRQLFERLAAEEGQHAMRIRLLSGHGGRVAWPQETLDRIGADLDAVSSEVAMCRGEFRTLAPSADARPVLRRLADMERRFTSIHAEELAKCGDPDVQRLFASLATQDVQHRELIEQALTRTAV
jgi:rubrerythrin